MLHLGHQEMVRCREEHTRTDRQQGTKEGPGARLVWKEDEES